MDSTFTCISSEELLVVEGGKIKTEDVYSFRSGT